MPEQLSGVSKSHWYEDSEPIHLWFSLSYANYLVLPRSVLQSMPQPWQARFCELLSEMDDAFGHLQWPPYDVRALAREAERLTYEPCFDCQGRGHLDGHPELQCVECAGLGEVETDRWEEPEEIGIITDPIPHYNRGRTKLEPQSR
jgi:hypothetical protein